MNTNIAIKDVVTTASGYVREAAPAAAVSEKKGGGGQEASSGVKQETGAAITRKEIEKTASEVQQHLKKLNTELKFEFDVRDGKVVVKIMDAETNDVIRQVPSEELMAIRERMEELIGILYDAKT